MDLQPYLAKIRQNHFLAVSLFPLNHSHTFGFSVSCQGLIKISTQSQLEHAVHSLEGKPFVILGEGSNTVFTEDFAGTVLQVAIEGKTVTQTETDTLIKVGAGENWHDFVTWCLANGYYGLENLALIPGTVGAAPIQNIGAYGVEVERFIDSVDYWDMGAKEVTQLIGEDCQFGYRDSVFKHELAGKVFITHVTFKLPKAWRPVCHYGELKRLVNPTANEIFEQVVAIRREKLPEPAEIGNAGSFFKNPVINITHFQQLQKRWPDIPHYPVNSELVKLPAAWLIDQLGFKGETYEGIRCHPTQPLVLTNWQSGTGKALLAFARKIRDKVADEFSILLENEVRLIGNNGLVTL